MREHLRTIILEPLTDGRRFALSLYDTGGRSRHGRPTLAYRFGVMGEAPIFDGADFSTGCSTGIDSDSALGSLLGFLTLRPGDTDSDYFESYSEAQRAWCDDPACEALTMAVETLENGSHAYDETDEETDRGMYTHPEHPGDEPWRVYTEAEPCEACDGGSIVVGEDGYEVCKVCGVTS